MQETPFQTGRRAIIAIYAVLILVPLIVVVAGSVKTTRQLYSSPFGLPTRPTLANFEQALGGDVLGRPFLNSVIVTTISVVATLALSSMVAFAAARLKGAPGNLLLGIFVLGLAVPAQVTTIPQYVLFQRLGLLDSLTGLVIANVVSGAPVAVFILTGFMKTLPGTLFETAAIDGASNWRIFRSIVIPLSRPSLAAAAIFLSVIQWNQLFFPLMFISDPAKFTLPLALLRFQGEFVTNYPLLFSGVLLASAPLIVAYVFLQRFFVAGMTAGAVKG